MTLLNMTQQFRCDCGWEGHEDDLNSKIVFWGNRYEPPEYDAFCPECNGSWENMEEVPYCAGCGDKFVKNEGDNCQECTEAILEDKHDGDREDAMEAEKVDWQDENGRWHTDLDGSIM